MTDSITYIGPVKCDNKVFLPIAPSKVSCGFPSAAEDWKEGKLDINDRLIKRPASTFLFIADGNSMIGAGILDGSIIVADRSVTPIHGKIVVATVYGEIVIKRLNLRTNPPQLEAANPRYKPIKDEFEIWGVVVGVATVL